MKHAHPSKRLHAAALISTLMLIAACSKEPAVPPPTTPLVEQRAADTTPATNEFHGSFAPGGIAATYRAIFSDGKIQSLEETRTATSQTGTYEFLGARLMKYRGTALGSNDIIELQLDEQGKVLTARAGDREASIEEITAIRDRAQALRSHAVARYDVQGHDPTQH
ncbi:MAG TPA: hypothetical protein VGE08_24120 [Steroidobacter sp.]|uniref:hypothetical protein n=1 Tax=Steroidobacter sp. TaxID=1978227 RepID=UPI002ED92DB0